MTFLRSPARVEFPAWTQQEMGAELLLELLAYLFLLNAWKEKLLQNLHISPSVPQQCFASVHSRLRAHPGPLDHKIRVHKLCQCHRCTGNLRFSPKAGLLLAWGKGCSPLKMLFHPWEVSAFLIQRFPGPHGRWINRCQIICFYFRDHKSGWIWEKH